VIIFHSIWILGTKFPVCCSALSHTQSTALSALGLSSQTCTSIIWPSRGGVRFRPASSFSKDIFIGNNIACIATVHAESHRTWTPIDRTPQLSFAPSAQQGGSASVNALASVYTERLELSCASAVVQQSACDIKPSQTQDKGLFQLEKSSCLQT
jgi:hypothetical protein